jgi:hypothetical protein
MVVSMFLAGCSSGSASPLANRHIVSDTRVCQAFNVAASPTAHFNSIYTGLASLASEAKDAGLRREGETLQTELRRHSLPGSAAAMNAYYQIGAVCVSHGLTPKDWPDLIWTSVRLRVTDPVIGGTHRFILRLAMETYSAANFAGST